MKLEALTSSLKTVGKFRILAARIDAKPDQARGICDSVKAKYPDAVCVIAAVFDGNLNFVSCAGSEAVALGAHAGNILREISAICGGKGGGRPDSAMSGGRDLDKIDEALKRAEEILLAI
jgi:alanyl-tRNA synthetase